jgi:glycosyltransferase involved in cell wall biosynthesis
MKNISVIITTYNAEDTIKRAILSVLNVLNKEKIEIIIIDDCSKDATAKIINEIIMENNNIKFIQLKENTGSPSIPRNTGIENATGQYITFLDDDDEMNTDNLLNMVNYAKLHELDCIKGYLTVVKGTEIIVMDKIECDNNNNIDVMKNIISGQSTRIDLIIKRDFLIENNIRFNKEYKVGEDTLFYADIFSYKPKIEYHNSFIHYHHKRTDTKNVSSTQHYQDKELKNHIIIWKKVQNKLNSIGINYYQLRLPIALKNTIAAIIFYSHGKISKEVFIQLSDFVNENKKILNDRLLLHKRYKDVYNTIVKNNYEKFLETSKRRLLISGYDLKFIKPIIKYLNDDYNIRIDEWTGHNTHNEKKSIDLLNWADFIFCEWLLGNSVWYSQRKMKHQKLMIRAHRFEITREFGNQVNYSNVDGIITVNYYYLEEFTNTFKMPREKMILLNNYLEKDIYKGNKTENYRDHIAMVGYIPKLKGLLKGLKILNLLKQENKNFKLFLFGKNYREVDWLWNDSDERSYFLECEEFIKKNNLSDSVIFKGWVEQSKIFFNVGYTLSVSDIESFHLAPAEGLCDLTLALILKWNGAEFIYPKEMIFDDITDIIDKIISTNKDDYEYFQLLKEMRDYVIKEYNVEKFVTELKLNLEKLALLN